LNPTLWMTRHGAMDEDRELLEAAAVLWRLAKKIKKAGEV